MSGLVRLWLFIFLCVAIHECADGEAHAQGRFMGEAQVRELYRRADACAAECSKKGATGYQYVENPDGGACKCRSKYDAVEIQHPDGGTTKLSNQPR